MINNKPEMTEVFDKEIDALLRQTAQGEAAFAVNNPKSKIQNPKSLHLDADEISLFAENALSAKRRQTAIAHFADCDRCREILSNVIAENAAVETVSTAAPIELFPATIPWYRRLFAFPNLAYTLGAFVVVFAGIIAFTVVQSVRTTQNAEVSQISERQLNGKGMSSDGEAGIIETPNSNAMMMSNSMSNAAMSNAAAPLPSNAARSNTSMSNVSTNSAARSSAANSSANSAPAATKPVVSANEFTTDGAQTDSTITSRQVSELPINGRAVNNFSLQKQESKKDADKSDNNETVTVTAPAPKSDQTVAGAENNSSTADSTTANSNNSVVAKLSAGRRNNRKLTEETTQTKQISGKTFERKNSIWTDSAYKNQTTINISRGTDEFKKLDSDLRSLAENLGGIIIVVWKDKAYRIQ